MVKTRVKICGITSIGDALKAIEYGADALGFVFAESSRRITPKEASKITKKIPPFVFAVGVFVDEERKTIERIIDLCGLHAVQLHGNETPQFCSRLRKKTKVIKSFRVKDESVLKLIDRYEVDAYLFDAFSLHQRGGSGRTFDWDIALKAKRILGGKPLILSGGLNERNIAEAILKVRPYAVDAATGVEKLPGKKDAYLLRRFIEKTKEH